MTTSTISNLYIKHNHTSDLTFVKNVNIIEYDMKDAGFNLLKLNSVFTKEEEDKLEKMDKGDRNIWIGKYLREHPRVSKLLMDEFVRARKLFFDANNIEDHHVISIKKDAIFVMKECNITKFNDYIEFRPKNKYIMYCNVGGKEFYYDVLNSKMDIKGFPKEVRKHHENFLFKDVKNILNMVLSDANKMKIAEELIFLKNDLVTHELPTGYYLDVIFGEYMVELFNGNTMAIPYIEDSVKKNCMINNNLNFILGLMSVLL